MSLLYLVGLYLIPGIFRIIALRDKNKNKEFLYNFSQYIQRYINLLIKYNCFSFFQNRVQEPSFYYFYK